MISPEDWKKLQNRHQAQGFLTVEELIMVLYPGRIWDVGDFIPPEEVRLGSEPTGVAVKVIGKATIEEHSAQVRELWGEEYNLDHVEPGEIVKWWKVVIPD